jgi:hypothetical protein
MLNVQPDHCIVWNGRRVIVVEVVKADNTRGYMNVIRNHRLKTAMTPSKEW